MPIFARAFKFFVALATTSLIAVDGNIYSSSPNAVSEISSAIFVTTADGPEGSALVTALLLQRGVSGFASKPAVIAGVADLKSAGARKLRALGAELRLVTSPPRAETFEGVPWVFVLAPLTADRFERGRDLIRAAHAGGVRNAVLLSVIGAGPSAPASLGAYYGLECELAQTWPSRSFAVLRTYFYQQNLLLWAADVVSIGAFRLPLASGCFAPLYEADVAAAVTALMQKRAPLVGQVFNLTGPRVLSGNMIAQVASRAVGRPGLVFEQVNRTVGAGIIEAAGGLDASEAALVLDLLMMQTSPAECAALPSADMWELIRRDATDVSSFFAEHAADFRGPHVNVPGDNLTTLYM
eukprot:TRINITY_DN56252_c0_g1_i1.p1 TRINITY_DN56252_c0_g1~~TRINITY_DN56252_c0_g1_i1.p1  ORF type:complete len:378 (+),score=25.34 TRINITY_DN56252_c0_g1_i1:78-1136(+)